MQTTENGKECANTGEREGHTAAGPPAPQGNQIGVPKVFYEATDTRVGVHEEK